METRVEEFSGSGNKPDDFALIETSIEGEGRTYPRFTKAVFRQRKSNMDSYKALVEKSHHRALKRLREIVAEYPDPDTVAILKREETVTFKWVRFTYKLNR